MSSSLISDGRGTRRSLIIGWLKGRGPQGRFWEIDLARGSAVLMMIAFHLLYDLDFFGVLDLPLYSGLLGAFAYSIGTIFLLLVGISLHLSSIVARRTMDERALLRKLALRGTGIFLMGMGVTLATYLILGNGYVIFGVLHCIGLSVILSYPFLRRSWLAAAAGTLMIGVGVVLAGQVFQSPWFVWLGLEPVDFVSVDYFPLLPWLGVVLLGIAIGRWAYPDGTRRYQLRNDVRSPPVRAMTWLGRHALIIYFLHQILLVGAISLLLSL